MHKGCETTRVMPKLLKPVLRLISCTSPAMLAVSHSHSRLDNGSAPLRQRYRGPAVTSPWDLSSFNLGHGDLVYLDSSSY